MFSGGIAGLLPIDCAEPSIPFSLIEQIPTERK
jgi:hypothetical protein